MEQEIATFDFDGTLALIDHRRHLVTNGNKKWDEFFLACDKDEPNVPVIVIARCLYESGVKIVIFSGRGEIARKKTVEWLQRYQVPCHELYMRPVNDYAPDEELKRQWLEKIDRDKMFWLSLMIGRKLLICGARKDLLVCKLQMVTFNVTKVKQCRDIF